MELAVLTLVGSLSFLLILVKIIKSEEGKEQRLFGPVRRFLDRLTLNAYYKYKQLNALLGLRALRVSLLYISNRFLDVIRHWFAAGVSLTEFWQRRNRQTARNLQPNLADNQLSAMIEHKNATSLNEKQKRQLRAETLEGNN